MIYDFINLTEWKKKPQILKELKNSGFPMDERKFRKLVETNNKMYAEHIEGVKFIAHSSSGYIATTDRELIISSLKDNNKRAMTMLMGNNKVLKALGENINLNLEME